MTHTPLHTRMLSVRMEWDRHSTIAVEGRVFDLRKRGIVPIAGRLQGPGVVHDMSVRLRVSAPALEVLDIEPCMSAYPFGHGPATNGEACPDILPNVQSLRGRSLAGGYGSVVTDAIGGPRGCFHIFTLMRLLGPTVEWAMQAHGTDAPGAPESPIFSRSVIIDGVRLEGLRLQLRGMLFDLHYPPGAETLPLEEELQSSYEATADVEVEIPSMSILACDSRVRRGGPGVGNAGSWKPVAAAAGLAGIAIRKGYTTAVEERLGAAADLRPLAHLLFMTAPTLMQCMPSLLEELGERPRRAEAPRAAADTCHMWRQDGPLLRMALPGG